MLRRAGADPDEVDTVILTHNHFDHAGCAGEFRNAHVYIQRREITEYQAARAMPRRFEFLTRSCEPALPELLDKRARDGLATLADGELEVAPGVSLWPAFGTHTAGSQVVSVTTGQNGRWLFAGDNVYAYENLEGLGGDGVLAPIAHDHRQRDRLAAARRRHAVRGRRRDPADHPVPRGPPVGALPVPRVRRRPARRRDRLNRELVAEVGRRHLLGHHHAPGVGDQLAHLLRVKGVHPGHDPVEPLVR